MEDMEVEVVMVSESGSSTEEEEENDVAASVPEDRSRLPLRRALRRRQMISQRPHAERVRRIQTLLQNTHHLPDTHTDAEPASSHSADQSHVQSTAETSSPAGPSVPAEAEAPAVELKTEVEASSDSSTSAAASPAGAADEADTEGESCSICFEPWTTAGEHRLAALRCGHLFGYVCISRWLTGGGNKCPQCNKPAKKAQIIFLYARRLKALDNTEEVRLKSRLELEQGSRRMEQLEVAQCRQQMQLMVDENLRLRKEVEELRRWKAQASVGSSQSASLSSSQRQDSGHYVFSKAVLVSQTGGSRVLAHCEPLGCLLASQPSPQATLMPGFGVKKISTATLKASQYVHIHSKQIRGLAFSQQQDGLLLSAALDNTIKLTSLMTNTVVQAYNTGRPVWSCCWCHDNNNYIYAGLSNGSVLVYDTRDTSTHVQELRPLRSSCPVVSLSYIPRSSTSSSFPCGGVIAGTLEGGCFWEQHNDNTHTPHILPLESGNCTHIQAEAESRHCLVTYRPGRLNPSLRCVLMELSRTPQVDLQSSVCSCSPVQTFSAGSSCKLLTKNCVFRSPAGGGGALVCAGDEATNSTMVWDAGTGALLQKMPADLPVLDICPFEANQSSFLASLTEKMIKVYKWE